MIRFSRFIWVYIFISGLVLVPGFISLLRFGLRPSIDFSGGSLIEVVFSKEVSPQQIEQSAKKQNISFATMQKSGTSTYILRTQQEVGDRVQPFIADIQNTASVTAQISRQETVGPVLGKELLSKAFVAALFAILAILAYVAYAFKDVKFGVAAVIALLHDLFVVLGIFSLLGYFLKVEVDTLFVTAFLTTMSFSVHDTIVVFDRIREYQKKNTKISFEDLCDKALTETMGRSFTNSMTIILMLLALTLMGGSTIRWFSIALLIGTVSGTYSSPFIATPALIVWNRLQSRKKGK